MTRIIQRPNPAHKVNDPPPIHLQIQNQDSRTMKDTDSRENPAELQANPCITLIIPYESKLKNKTHLDSLLRLKADETEKELLNCYPMETVSPLVSKLRNMLKTVHCAGQGKTIGIFVSPSSEKVYYFSPSHLEDFRLPRLVKTMDE
jgi:hypothetical protein